MHTSIREQYWPKKLTTRAALRAVRLATAADYRAQAQHLADIGDVAGAIYAHGRAQEIEILALNESEEAA